MSLKQDSNTPNVLQDSLPPSLPVTSTGILYDNIRLLRNMSQFGKEKSMLCVWVRGGEFADQFE